MKSLLARLRRKTADLARMRTERDELIKEAADAEIPFKEIAAAADMTKGRVSQIASEK